MKEKEVEITKNREFLVCCRTGFRVLVAVIVVVAARVSS